MGQSFGEAIPLNTKQPQISQYPIEDGSSTLNASRPRAQHRQYQFFRKLTYQSPVWHVIKILIALSPLLFIVYAITALIVSTLPKKGNELYATGSETGVLIFALLTPTLFPIVFSAVAGRLMRNYALWSAEKGASLGLIEQFHGSQSLVSALERSYLAPKVGTMGFLVVFLWFLSPMGGQSSARVYSFQPNSEVLVQSGQVDIYYYDSTVVPDANATIGVKSDNLAPVMDSVLSRSLLIGSTSSHDAWGNPKVIFLNETCPGPESCTDLGSTTFHSSLTGLLISNTDSLSSVEFTAHASYYNLTCSKMQNFTTTEELTLWAGKLLLTTNPSWLLTSQPDHANTSFLLDTNWVPPDQNASNPIDSQFNIVFATNQPFRNSGSIGAFKCSVGFTHVDLNCSRTSGIYSESTTSIDTARISTNASVGSNFVPFWRQQPYAKARVEFLLQWLSHTLPVKKSGDMALLDAYIQGIDEPYMMLYGADVNHLNPDPKQFNLDSSSVAERLGQLLNTAWQMSTLQYNLIKIGWYDRGTWQDPESLADLSGNLTGRFPIAKAVVEKAKVRGPVFDMKFFILTLIISSILLVCGILGLCLEYHTKSPDVLGYVSSLVRDHSEWEKVPGGHLMDGLEYAKAVSATRVQLSSANDGGAVISGGSGVLRRATRS